MAAATKGDDTATDYRSLYRLMSALKKEVRHFLNATHAAWHLVLFFLRGRRKIRKSKIVFFFPYYHTGGAERVHLDIVRAFPDAATTVVFTMRSATTNFLSGFTECSAVVQAHHILTRKAPFFERQFRSLLAKTINTAPNIETVFGSNASFFYQIIPLLRDDIRKIDLFHAFAPADDRAPVVASSAPFIDTRVVINQKGQADLARIYRSYDVPLSFDDRIRAVRNGVTLPSGHRPTVSDVFTIAYIGRWSPEKRPHLFLAMAERLRHIGAATRCIMVGTGMRSHAEEIAQAGVEFLGEVTDTVQLSNLYHQIDAIVITSEYEGFPMVLMEGMAHGVIPISVDVGGIAEHISSSNGILLPNENESAIVEQLISSLKSLIADPELRARLSSNACEYAFGHFGKEKFNHDYRQLLGFAS